MVSKSILKIIVTVTVALLFTGCASVTGYRKPLVKLENSWKAVKESPVYKESKPGNRWWRKFNDTSLTELMEMAGKSSPDIKIAMARIDEYEARVNQSEAGWFPVITASGTVSRSLGMGRNMVPGKAANSSRGNVSASWELDFFGRVRKGVKASKYDSEAIKADYSDVLLSIYSRIAETYLNIRTRQAQLKSAEDNIRSQKKTLELISSRLKHGLASELDYARTERLLARAESQVPQIRSAIFMDISNLAVLMGKEPEYFADKFSDFKPIPYVPEFIDVGTPSSVISRRPDVRKAGMMLEARAARVGVAKAEILPVITVDGSWGRDSMVHDDKTWSLGSSVKWEIFTGGRRRSEIKVRKSQFKQAEETYEKTVLAALKEVKDSLKTVKEDKIRVGQMERAVKAAKRSVKLSMDLYSKGIENLQTVLDAQRDQFDFENTLAEARGNAAGNFVKLNVALGSGWVQGNGKVATEKPSVEENR